ncbi:hypothetical protein J833_4093, partial [Acinetobacter baumannii 25691_10]
MPHLNAFAAPPLSLVVLFESPKPTFQIYPQT